LIVSKLSVDHCERAQRRVRDTHEPTARSSTATSARAWASHRRRHNPTDRRHRGSRVPARRAQHGANFLDKVNRIPGSGRTQSGYWTDASAVDKLDTPTRKRLLVMVLLPIITLKGISDASRRACEAPWESVRFALGAIGHGGRLLRQSRVSGGDPCPDEATRVYRGRGW
jgi:hypothetical protein